MGALYHDTLQTPPTANVNVIRVTVVALNAA